MRIPISLLAPFLLSGCETLAYYAQAVGGQMALMARARPAAELIADPATPQPLRERLELARLLTTDRRHFAAVRPSHTPAFELLP